MVISSLLLKGIKRPEETVGLRVRKDEKRRNLGVKDVQDTSSPPLESSKSDKTVQK